MNLNVDRLKSYKARLIVFPRRAGVIKKGDSSAAEIAEAQKTNVDIASLPKKAEAVTFAAITEVRIRVWCAMSLILVKLLCLSYFHSPQPSLLPSHHRR